MSAWLCADQAGTKLMPLTAHFVTLLAKPAMQEVLSTALTVKSLSTPMWAKPANAKTVPKTTLFSSTSPAT